MSLREVLLKESVGKDNTGQDMQPGGQGMILLSDRRHMKTLKYKGQTRM